MNRFILPVVLVIMLPASALAVECVNGIYRAGCAGPNGAASVNKNTGATHSTSTGGVNCAEGRYAAGCKGPNGGAAVIRR
jgi:hypothetical protein